MKQLYTLLIACLVITVTSCKAPFFNTANNMRMINGTLFTNDGKEIPGQLTLNLDNYRSSRLYVTIVPKEGKEQRINITDIKGINIRGDYYEPKLIDMGGLGNNDEFRFVKRMTKEGSRIHLYELYEQRTRQTGSSRYNPGGNTYSSPEYSYFITTPAHTRNQSAWNLEGRRLTPNFEDKMSEIVKDCPALSEKIRRKEKGYFYAQVSLIESKRIETMFTIIDEYNRCNQPAAAK